MAENPFDEGMTDFGLLSSVDGDVLGSPDKIVELQNQLAGIQATLGTPPPNQNNWLDAGIRGAMVGSQGYMEDPLTGERSQAPNEGGFGQGLLAGIGAAVEGQQANALAKYEHEQQVARDAMEQREKVAAGIRMVLAQNPMALAELGSTEQGQRIIGQMAYGMDIPIDPSAKSDAAKESLSHKQRIQYYTQLVKSATSPQAKAAAAQQLKDLVDPDGLLTIDVKDMAAGKIPSYSEIAKLYGDPGVAALNTYNIDKDVESFMTKLGTMKARDATKAPTILQTKVSLANKISDIKKDYRDVNGKDLTDVDAIKQLPDEDRLLAEQYFKETTGGKDDVSFTRYISVYEKAWDDQPQDLKDSSPDEARRAAHALAVHRIGAARDTKKKLDAAESRVAPATKETKGAVPIALPKWISDVKARALKSGQSLAEAERALIMEMEGAGKLGNVPPAARKRAGK